MVPSAVGISQIGPRLAAVGGVKPLAQAGRAAAFARALALWKATRHASGNRLNERADRLATGGAAGGGGQSSLLAAHLTGRTRSVMSRPRFYFPNRPPPLSWKYQPSPQRAVRGSGRPVAWQGSGRLGKVLQNARPVTLAYGCLVYVVAVNYGSATVL